MDIMKSINNYKEEEQANILATLNVVQGKGWSPENQDPMQFHIILGEKIRESEEKIRYLEDNLDSYKEENLQKEKEIRDLNKELKQERDNCEDLEVDLNRKEDELKEIKTQLQIKKKVKMNVLKI